MMTPKQEGIMTLNGRLKSKVVIMVVVAHI